MLDLVTITGADDNVDPKDLVALSVEYPFVEWGLLASAKRAGTARYPSIEWLARLRAACDSSGVLPYLSLHLCGADARRALTGDMFVEHLPERGFHRVQVNAYEAPSSPTFLDLVRSNPNLEFIFQARSQEQLRLAFDEATRLSNANVLYDPSGGRGIDVGTDLPEVIPQGLLVGVAGGINPENVGLVHERAVRAGYSWIDMESGVRTDDKFDLAKVRSVLETCAVAR